MTHTKKTETEEDEDILTVGMSEVAATLQLTTLLSDDDGGRRWRRQIQFVNKRNGSSLTADHIPEWRRWNLILLLSCDPLTPEPMKHQQSLQLQVCPVPEIAFRKTNGFEALTDPSGCANWSDKKSTCKIFGTTALTEQCLVVFVPDSPLSHPQSIIFPCSVKAQHIWLANHLKQTVNTLLVGQSFHNVPSHNSTFPSLQNGYFMDCTTWD